MALWCNFGKDSNMQKPKNRLATEQDLEEGQQLTLEGNAAHYLTHVLRLKEGDAIALFNNSHGEWRARLSELKKRSLTLTVEEQLRPPAPAVDLWVCFAPIKGGRMETVIEKATELGASVLQPVLTNRTIVDKVNIERAGAIAREAAEQCERTDWPEIREAVKLERLLGNWPEERLLIYGDESGDSKSVNDLFRKYKHGGVESWAVLAGPEGGFSREEFAALKHVKNAVGVSLGPRILRADTAIITLCALTLAQWGDWNQLPNFRSESA